MSNQRIRNLQDVQVGSQLVAMHPQTGLRKVLVARVRRTAQSITIFAGDAKFNVHGSEIILPPYASYDIDNAMFLKQHSALAQSNAQTYWTWEDLDAHWNDLSAVYGRPRQVAQHAQLAMQIKAVNLNAVPFDTLMQITALLGEVTS